MFADDICGRKLDNSRGDIKPALSRHPARFEKSLADGNRKFEKPCADFCGIPKNKMGEALRLLPSWLLRPVLGQECYFFLATAFLAAGFLAGALAAGAFLTGAFLAGAFLAGAFLATGFFATAFLAAGLAAAAFLATGFLATGFLAAGFLAAGFFATGI
jgi:hypothetical protein